MKKIFAALVILGLGVMVGCGDDSKTGGKPSGTLTSTTSTTTHTTAVSSGTK